MKDLKILNLSIPTLDSSECKALMGGDGYAWEIELPEVIVTPDNNRADHSDYDNHDDILDDDQNDYDHDNDGEQGIDKGSFNVDNMVKHAQPQVGNACVFAAINAMLCGFGQESALGWFGIASDYANGNDVSIDSILDGSFNGVTSDEMSGLLEQYFDNVSPVDSDGLSESLDDGPVYGILNPGDTDGNGEEDDGHAVVIIDYDEDSGTVYYWDPESGQMGNGDVGDYIQGWSVAGAKG